MAKSLENPGDVLEGQGQLLRHGQLVARVNYFLTIPTQIHFLINPTGQLNTNYEEYAAGFILLTPEDADTLALDEYMLELADKSKKIVRVERRYTEVKHEAGPRISFWVKVIEP